MICPYVVEKGRYTSSTFNFQLMITCMTYFKNCIGSSFFIIELCESKEGSTIPWWLCLDLGYLFTGPIIISYKMLPQPEQFSSEVGLPLDSILTDI